MSSATRTQLPKPSAPGSCWNVVKRYCLIPLLLLTAGNGCSSDPSAPAEKSQEDSTAADQAAAFSATDLSEGWIQLFDGSTLFGWQAGSDANWQVVDGTITVSKGEKGLLCTTSSFANYMLSLEFRSEPGTNSGIFLHTSLVPSDPAEDCYELNIADADNPFPTGSLVKREKVTGNFDRQGWQRYEITVLGKTITVVLDGQQVLQYEDAQPLQRGLIGLQLNEGKVAFRNIKLKPLQLDSIFNGKDLEGWQTYPEMASKFTVTKEGWLNVQDGRGQLETKTPFADFVLQLECITHAKELNSGLFFRCIPGDVMMGYECQIHNGVENQDPTKPQDCGTGGFFRRQNARRVVAEDLKWFHTTLIVDGPHMAAWVNGYQVSDWTDQRPPHENPRKGLREQAGTLMIQGHDPTTNISFRNLQARELPTRAINAKP